MPSHDAAGPLPYPIAAIRDRYVSPFSGVSYDLAPWEIGVNRTALAANTRLTARAEVLVNASDPPPDARSRSLVLRPLYRVVPLDPARPDALRLSPRGEVVFSSFELDASDRSVLPWLRPGDPVVLNAALSRFPLDFRRVL